MAAVLVMRRRDPCLRLTLELFLSTHHPSDSEEESSTRSSFDSAPALSDTRALSLTPLSSAFAGPAIPISSLSNDYYAPNKAAGTAEEPPTMTVDFTGVFWNCPMLAGAPHMAITAAIFRLLVFALRARPACPSPSRYASRHSPKPVIHAGMVPFSAVTLTSTSNSVIPPDTITNVGSMTVVDLDRGLGANGRDFSRPWQFID
ncbi:hypothetical protein GGX14DRAFT_571310 [Mycena pura]|uniref:Uncharacterized protein n=1 Tax=Mycena pura TaxID=153505 RepID=A0AAD6VAM9_9AGAR|nr:hypothetical protein GGX14DRAFT_571310 [Mycena pura]